MSSYSLTCEKFHFTLLLKKIRGSNELVSPFEDLSCIFWSLRTYLSIHFFVMTKLILSQKPWHFYQQCHCWKSNTYIWTKVSFIIGETTIMKNILITLKKKLTSLKCLQNVSLQKTLNITSNIKKTYILIWWQQYFFRNTSLKQYFHL